MQPHLISLLEIRSLAQRSPLVNTILSIPSHPPSPPLFGIIQTLMKIFITIICWHWVFLQIFTDLVSLKRISCNLCVYPEILKTIHWHCAPNSFTSFTPPFIKLLPLPEKNNGWAKKLRSVKFSRALFQGIHVTKTKSTRTDDALDLFHSLLSFDRTF